MPGWTPSQGCHGCPLLSVHRLQFWAPPASQAPPLHPSTVEEFKGTYEKDNLEGGGDVMPSKCLSHVEEKEAV